MVTGSLYRRGDTVILEECKDELIISFINTVLKNNGCIADAFVIDVAVRDRIPYILEINNINSSGLYDIDSQKFIMAIEELGELYKERK